MPLKRDQLASHASRQSLSDFLLAFRVIVFMEMRG